MTISVEAEEINMTSHSQNAIEECSVAEYVCETDSAFPKAPVVLWYIGDSPVDIKYGHSIENNASTMDNNEQAMTSILKLTAQRGMNGKTVKCVLENDENKFEERILTVTCKYLLVHKNS